VTETAVQGRRLIGKLILFLTGCWLLVLAAAVVGALRGASVEPLNFALMLIPGCAFVPAAYFAIGLFRTTDPAQLNKLVPKAIVYGVSGLALLFSTAYALYQMSRS